MHGRDLFIAQAQQGVPAGHADAMIEDLSQHRFAHLAQSVPGDAGTAEDGGQGAAAYRVKGVLRPEEQPGIGHGVLEDALLAHQPVPVAKDLAGGGAFVNGLKSHLFGGDGVPGGVFLPFPQKLQALLLFSKAPGEVVRIAHGFAHSVFRLS